MRRPDRRYATVWGTLVLALALRLPWLGSTPNPSGDEGNWTWIAWKLLRGHPVELPPDARFVPLTFAWLIAGSYRLLGPSFASARAVLVLGLVTGSVLAFVLARRIGAPRAALAVVVALALHPWAVLWSRTVTVPYALSLALSVVGPLAFLDAQRTRDPWRMLLAAQLLGFGFHFSPLAAIPLGACVLHSFGTERPRGRTLAAASTALVHVLPMACAALRAARGNPGRPGTFFTAMPQRLHVFVRTLLGAVDGEATLRHFTGTQWEAMGEWVSGTLSVAIVVVALGPPRGEPAVVHTLARMARVQWGLALVGLPLLLAPARPWNLPAIDAERYGFIVVAPFVLSLAALAERTDRARHLLPVALVATCLLPTLRGVWFFARGGSSDRGAYTLAGGGGYRGWKVAREREALSVLLRRELDGLRAGAPATFVVADYAFHPLHFVNAEGGVPTVDVTKFPLPVRPGELHGFVRWSDGLFAPGFTPRAAREDNERLTALLRSPVFEGARRVRVFVQPDGSPLCELWVAVRAVR